jgi:membrane fusion protein (multidrug efflux system)
MRFGYALTGGVLIAASTFLLASAALMPGTWLPSFRSDITDNAYVRGEITPISPKISGYLVEVLVQDNQAVKRGDILFRVDDTDFKAKVLQAEAQLAADNAAIENLDSEIELQKAVVRQANAALQGADAEAYRAKRDFDRATNLSQSGSGSGANVDTTQAASLRADAAVAAAQANVEASRRQVHVFETKRPQLLAAISSAEAAVKLAQFDLDGTIVRSPEDGWVGARQAQLGQYVKPGGLLIPFVSDDVWVVANFKETQLPEISIGQEVSIDFDGIDAPSFKGHVESLSPASGAQFALLPPDNATGNFTRIVQRVPVRIGVDPGQQKREQLRPGMSAMVRLLKERRPAQ